MNVYFLYRPHKTFNQVADILPAYQAGVTLNLYVNDGWVLGKMDTEVAPANYLDQIREYSPVVIDEAVATGYPLVGITQILVSQDADGENKVYRDLTADEVASVAAATAMLAKLGVRTQIEITVGDNADLVADLSKRVALLSRILMAVYNNVEKGTDISAEIATVVDTYTADHAAGNIIDTIDINGKTLLENYVSLRDRNTQITDILTSYYGA